MNGKRTDRVSFPSTLYVPIQSNENGRNQEYIGYQLYAICVSYMKSIVEIFFLILVIDWFIHLSLSCYSFNIRSMQEER